MSPNITFDSLFFFSFLPHGQHLVVLPAYTHYSFLQLLPVSLFYRLSAIFRSVLFPPKLNRNVLCFHPEAVFALISSFPPRFSKRRFSFPTNSQQSNTT